MADMKPSAQGKSNDGPAAALYERLKLRREGFLERARECAKLTIPSILTEEGHTQDEDLAQPWQALGARGVNNLSAKLLLTLLPANGTFFRLVVDYAELKKQAEKLQLTDATELKERIEKQLSLIETEVMKEMESQGIRPSVFEAIKHLLVAGNVLINSPKGGGLKVYHLDRFVVCRDPMGNILHIVVKEDIAFTALPEGVQEMIKQDAQEDDKISEKVVSIYTCVHREDSHWTQYQEVMGIEIPGSRGNLPLEKGSWFAPRMIKVDGEDYGRSYVEEYIGDLRSLDALQEAVISASAGAAKMVWRVDPACVSSADDLFKQPNGGAINARAGEIECIQANKNGDLNAATAAIERITQQVSQAFLLNSSIQRSGERVTAEEIRLMANELESALGGIYSLLSIELQLPLVKRTMAQMERQNKLPKLPSNLVKPTIVTGIEALGRGNDLQKLQLFMQQITALTPEVAQRYIKPNILLARIATALSLDIEGLIKTEEEIAGEMQQEQAQNLIQQHAGEAMKLASQQGVPTNVEQGQPA